MNSKTESRSKLLAAVKVSFFLLIFSLGFLQPDLTLFEQKIPLTDLLFVLCGLLYCVLFICSKLTFKWHRFYWFLIIYLATIAFSAAFSPDLYRNGIKFVGEIYLAGLAVLTFNLVDGFDSLKRFAQVWLAATFVVCIIGLVSILLFYFQPDNWVLTYTQYHYGAVPVGNYPRISSMSLSASMFCNYLVVSLSLLLILKTNEQMGKKAFALMLVLIIINAVFTISSGLGAFFLVFGLWYWFINRSQKPAAAKASLIIGTAFSILLLLSNIIALQKYPTAPFGVKIPIVGITIYPSSRFLVWRESFETFLQNPWVGVGVGNDSCSVIFQNTDGSNSVLTDAHNIFLSVASHTGIFGLVCFLFGIALLLRELFPISSEVNEVNTIRFGLATAFVAAFVYQGFLGSFEETRHLWVLIGLILACGHSIIPDPEIST